MRGSLRETRSVCGSSVLSRRSRSEVDSRDGHVTRYGELFWVKGNDGTAWATTCRPGALLLTTTKPHREVGWRTARLTRLPKLSLGDDWPIKSRRELLPPSGRSTMPEPITILAVRSAARTKHEPNNKTLMRRGSQGMGWGRFSFPLLGSLGILPRTWMLSLRASEFSQGCLEM